MSEIEIAAIEHDPRQMEMFETKDHGQEMSLAEFTSWMSENYGSGIGKFLQIAAFLLCCDVIAQDIAKSTLRLRERLENGTSKIVHPTQHEIAGLLALEPNRRHTWYEFVEMLVLWSCMTSNAYAGVLRNNFGDPTELIPFQSTRITEKIEGRDVFYDVVAGTMQEQALLGAGFKTFHERDMIHVRGRMYDGMDGFSTIRAGKTTLDTSAAIEKFRGKLFSEEGQTRGVFTREKEGTMDEVAFQRLRQQFKILMSKFRQLTEPIVLEDGIKFSPISSKPQEIELAKQFEAQINEVCRLLRVPPHKVFAMDGSKYTNLETMEKAYVGDTLVPIAERFEQRYSKVLLSKKDRLKYFFEHDRSEMTLRDTKLETDRVIRAVERGVILIDEARAVLGYNPLGNDAGQTRTIPVNMVVVDENNEVIIGASGTDGLEPEKPEAEPEETEASKKAALRLVSNN